MIIADLNSPGCVDYRNNCPSLQRLAVGCGLNLLYLRFDDIETTRALASLLPQLMTVTYFSAVKLSPLL